ncbi:MAG: hypothetical protein KDA75_04860 [Planctomycetaceae bacterium]|nr:hypothetical protein [Planctomycetaceae bacterium]
MFRPILLQNVSCAVLSVIGLAGLSREAAAAPECPYDATVRTNEVEVRSGPGQRYYVTGRVKQGDRVTVHRHDPGGWYMIAPPAGSFSWIEASQVRRTGDASGVVELAGPDAGGPGRAVVRIGSEFSDEQSYYGRELSTGDEVQILGEKTLNTDRGPVRMYKIVPPSLEYRWVKGDFIVPADGTVTTKVIRDSLVQPVAGFDVDPLGPAVPAAKESDPFAGFQAERAADSVTETTTSPRMPVGAGARDTMMALDARYLELIRQSPDQWDLDGLIRDYTELGRLVDEELGGRINERLAALESRRKVWNDYREFVALTRETSEKDAELVAMQTGALPTATTSDTSATVTSPESGPVLPGLEAGALPQPTPAQPVPGEAANQAIATSVPTASSGMSGAGIIQRLPTGPRGQFLHVLTDSQGRVLAILQPMAANIPLDRHLGQSIGVVGRRFFDPRVQSDVIQVQQLVPVQLVP